MKLVFGISIVLAIAMAIGTALKMVPAEPPAPNAAQGLVMKDGPALGLKLTNRPALGLHN